MKKSALWIIFGAFILPAPGFSTEHALHLQSFPVTTHPPRTAEDPNLPRQQLAESPLPVRLEDGCSCSSLSQCSDASLMEILASSGYDCTQSIADELAPNASNSLASELITMAGTHSQGLARRNALRVLGLFAGKPITDDASILVLTTRAADVKALLLDRLQNDSYQDALQDAIWIFDTYYFPDFSTQPHLETISATTAFDTSLRYRAIRALGRLLSTIVGLVPDEDLDFVLDSLQSDDLYVRAQAAYICESFTGGQLNVAKENLITAALSAQYTVETVFVAKFYIARALDHFNGNTDLVTSMLAEYESAHLSQSSTQGAFTIQSGLAASELGEFLDLLEVEEAAFFELLGSSFTTPVAGDVNPTMTLKLFATQSAYQNFMETFVGFGASAGGLYLEGSGTLYTYDREASQSAFTVQELIQHEFGHYLQGRYVYPGIFTDAGYHTQPKGWADEGLAEYLAGLRFDDDGGYSSRLRPVYLPGLCADPDPDLDTLLNLRAGYDEAGVFDYRNAWAFLHFLMNKRTNSALRVYDTYREETYTAAGFAAAAGETSIDDVETEWHRMIDAWCGDSDITSVPTTCARLLWEGTKGDMTVDIPANAFDSEVEVTLTETASVPSVQSGLAGTGIALDITVNTAVQPSQPINLTIGYSDQDVLTIDESHLLMARYDEGTGQWITLSSNVDETANSVTAATDHLSLFQLVYTAAAPTAAASVFPNPLRNSFGQSMTVRFLTANSEAKIFTVTGMLVKRLTADVNGEALWDGTNEERTKVASGVYFIAVDENGTKKTRKVVVQK